MLTLAATAPAIDGVYGFAKNGLSNIDRDDDATLPGLARELLPCGASAVRLATLLALLAGEPVEVECDEQEEFNISDRSCGGRGLQEAGEIVQLTLCGFDRLCLALVEAQPEEIKKIRKALNSIRAVFARLPNAN